MLTKQQIQALIEAQGMRMLLRNEHSKKGNGTSRVYVRAHKYLGPKQEIWLELGRIETVEQMGQEELIEAISQKFAEKLALKCSQSVSRIKSVK